MDETLQELVKKRNQAEHDFLHAQHEYVDVATYRLIAAEEAINVYIGECKEATKCSA